MGRIATLSTICSILAMICVITLEIRQVSAISSLVPTEGPKMEMRIDQPIKKDSKEKYFHQVDSNVVLLNMTGVWLLRLDCWAPYPIDLRFYGHLTNQETTVRTFRDDYGNGTADNPKSWFIINATMESYEQVTGNYTCFSIEYPHLLSSYYLFVSPTLPGVLLTRGQRIRIQVKPEERRVILPCAVSHPGVHVYLYKYEENITPPLEEKSYDPKVGFILDLELRDRYEFGNYSCRTELSPKDRTNFTLVPPEKFRAEPRTSHIQIHPNNQLNVSCDATQDFIMVIEPPTLQVIQNKVIKAETPFAHYQYRGQLVSARLSRKDSGYVYCKWKDSEKTFAQWSFAVREMKRPGELDSTKLNSACPNATHLIVYECSNPVECRINSCLRKDSQCQSNGQMCVTLSDQHCVQSGLIQCAVDVSSVMEIFFTGFPTSTMNKTNRYVGWENVSVDELLLLKQERHDLSAVYRRDKSSIILKQFSCQGSNFVFSSGFKWILHFKDKAQLEVTSLKDITENKMNASVTNNYGNKKSIVESTLRISLDKFSKRRIAFIECKAPVWNSWQWMTRKIPVAENSAVSINLSRLSALLAFFGIYYCLVL